MSGALFTAKDKSGIAARLRRIEGQVRGLQRMIDEERDCADVIQQLSAARAALDRVGNEIVVSGLRGCLSASKLDRGMAARLEQTIGAVSALRS